MSIRVSVSYSQLRHTQGMDLDKGDVIVEVEVLSYMGEITVSRENRVTCAHGSEHDSIRRCSILSGHRDRDEEWTRRGSGIRG
jgi:hypothetical protein